MAENMTGFIVCLGWAIELQSRGNRCQEEEKLPKRDILPDPKYNSKLVAKFVNKVMRRGKKSLAERILYGALDLIEQRSKQDPLEVFHKAMDNVQACHRGEIQASGWSHLSGSGGGAF